MFVRKRQWKNRTYYYLVRHAGNDQQETLTTLGYLDSPDPLREQELVLAWWNSLQAGAESAMQRMQARDSEVRRLKRNEANRTFDFEKCMEELRQVYREYGRITKTLLEKEARPKKKISWGTQTLLKNFRARGLSFKEVFEEVKREVSACVAFHGQREPSED